MSWETDVCNDTLQQYLKAFDTALLQYNEDMTQWYRHEPLTNSGEYPAYKSALYSRLGDQEYMSKIQADCKSKGLGYMPQGSCPAGFECQLECRMTDIGIGELLDRWGAAKPTFAAPKLEEYVCSQCEQVVRNYVGNVSEDATALYRNVVQEAVQECVLNLNTSGTQDTSQTTPDPETEEQASELPTFTREEFTFTALVCLALVLLVLIGFSV